MYKRVDLDMRRFKRLRMFLHAESLNNPEQGACAPITDGEVTAFIRIGDDFQNNFYEYEVPLTVTQPNHWVERPMKFAA